MLQHLNLRVFGQVQGMGFRATARERALKLGLTGFARNEPDGSVYVEVEGEAAALARFVRWCQRGPWWARVSRVEIKEGNQESFVGFDIR